MAASEITHFSHKGKLFPVGLRSHISLVPPWFDQHDTCIWGHGGPGVCLDSMSAPTRAGTPQPSLPASRKGTVQSRATDVGLKSRIWEPGAQCGKACPGSSNLNHGSGCSSQIALASYLSSPLHGLQKSQLGRQDWVKLG